MTNATQGPDRAEAQKLADNINVYWLRRGYDVHAGVVREKWVRGNQRAGFTVRSLLRNGMPPAYCKVKS